MTFARLYSIILAVYCDGLLCGIVDIEWFVAASIGLSGDN